MTDEHEPSPRPWRVAESVCGWQNCIEDANGNDIGSCWYNRDRLRAEADAALIVDAVNERAKFEEARMEFPDLRPVIIAAGQRDAAIAERDRLRDIVRRLITIHQNIYWRKDEKTGMLYYDCAIDEEKIRKTIEEARAAIGEDRT